MLYNMLYYINYTIVDFIKLDIYSHKNKTLITKISTNLNGMALIQTSQNVDIPNFHLN